MIKADGSVFGFTWWYFGNYLSMASVMALQNLDQRGKTTQASAGARNQRSEESPTWRVHDKRYFFDLSKKQEATRSLGPDIYLRYACHGIWCKRKLRCNGREHVGSQIGWRRQRRSSRSCTGRIGDLSIFALSHSTHCVCLVIPSTEELNHLHQKIGMHL